ncbi:outer membrane protein assembly factor BamC [Viridibacterium curvum]|uniref:Outer membrane protein assembly factor BamC n=1 Tax=Viridibacterium curvum TaxID=1101404 RepID=A0ABP9QF03_9RHOO
MFRSVSARGCLTLSACALALLLSACASDKDPVYRSDTKRVEKPASRALEVPPDLITPTRDERLQTPDPRRASATASGQQAAAQQAQQAKPAAAVSSPDKSGNARIVKAGAQKWLVVNGTADAVWPQVRKFWEDLGFAIDSDNTKTYVMETDWAEKRVKSGIGVLLNAPLIRTLAGGLDKDKFRTRLELGAEPGTIEIYVSHRGLEQTDLSSREASLGWVTRPADPSQELDMLRRMMIAFGAEEAVANQAVAMQAAPDKARLGTAADGTQQLVVDDPLDRAWRQIGLSLDRIGMVVEDRDRSKGYYFVRYITDVDLEGKPSKGWFSWLNFWSSDKPAETDLFRISVAAEGDKTVVRVANRTGGAAAPASVKRILGLLHTELR